MLYSDKKLFGVVYTPYFVVCKILDDVGYNSPAVLGKKIIDPACGDGCFLIEIVRRIIKFSPKNELKKNLECVYGWDIDAVAVMECRENLNELVKDKNIDIQWNVSVTNSIEKYEKPDLLDEKETQKFDFIVGNPPYIRIQHLDIVQRTYLQKNFEPYPPLKMGDIPNYNAAKLQHFPKALPAVPAVNYSNF